MSACCEGTGIITWEDDGKRYWAPCGCEVGDQLTADLDQGMAEIAAGRLHKWSDVKRESDRRRRAHLQ